MLLKGLSNQIRPARKSYMDGYSIHNTEFSVAFRDILQK
jgi:hypothetical protein